MPDNTPDTLESAVWQRPGDERWWWMVYDREVFGPLLHGQQATQEQATAQAAEELARLRAAREKEER